MKIEINKDKMASEINVNEVRASAFQSLLPMSECNRLARCGDGISGQTASKSALVSPTAAPTSAGNNAAYASNSSSNNGSSPKMGSRRIFTPQFKLQVLESYRSDSDCKGNQRATARKYNIHRRQIQKWLQCESNLRSSVANINQNSVKHQFHNISHHQQQAATPARMQLPHSTSSASLNGATNGYSHHHPHHHSQALALNQLNVPSMPPRLDASGSSSAQGVLAAANLAAALAVAVASTSSPSTSTTAVSPLRPTAINGTSGGVNNGVSKLSPSLLHAHHHHHHHHFSMPPYTHAPVAGPVPVTVPMLTHHLSAAPPPQPHALHQHYPYHSLPTRTHSHPLRLSHQPSAFLPTACLPVNVLSAVAAASAADIPEKKAEENRTDANVELGETEAGTPPTAVQPTMTAPPNAVLTGSAHGYMHEANEYECMYRKAAAVAAAESDGVRDAKCKNYLQHSTYQYAEQDCLGASMTTPMDLSVGRRRRDSATTEENIDITKCHPRENCSTSSTATQIVDLTFRKRKVITASALSIDTEHPLKLAKRLEETDSSKTSMEYTNGSDAAVSQSANEEDEEVEIEVDVESKQTSSKPVKLFKPYLLDNNEDGEQSSAGNQKEANSDLGIGEQREPIIWINHPAYDSSRASSMYSPSAEKHTFHGGSPYFLASKPSSPQSVLSPISTASLSPTNFLRCPKGSPVSGYESSSSVCSERDETCSLTECRSYSLDFQMQAAPENKLTSQPLHIRQWLDQDTNTETNTPPLARASIALYA